MAKVVVCVLALVLMSALALLVLVVLVPAYLPCQLHHLSCAFSHFVLEGGGSVRKRYTTSS